MEYETDKDAPKQVKIAILQRGWVAVGRFSQVGANCRLTHASIVHRWGTTKGIGEIAALGPTSNTVLHSSPDISYHELTAVMHIDCVEEKWAKYC